MRRPKVLFLSRRFLYPLDTGGKIRTAKILEQLRERWKTTIIGQYDARTDAPFLTEMQALGDRYVAVPPPQPPRGLLARSLGRLRKLLSPYPLAALYDTTSALQAAVSQELERHPYDLLVCDFLQSSLNVPDQRRCPAVLFTHNVESRILWRQAAAARGPAARWFWRLQHARMRRFEASHTARFERVIAVSDSDRREFEEAFGLTNVRTIPTGVDSEYFRPTGDPSVPCSIVFCGSMDWLPNQDGVIWFVESVLPLVRRKVAHATLTVVGRHPPATLMRQLSGTNEVIFTGWVSDVRPHVSRAACYVVPVRIGGGTRIKIYEALAMERPVVSTSVGAEGLPLEPQLHYHLADDASEFAERVVECLGAPGPAREMGRRGRNFVRERFGWARVASAFAEAAEEAMKPEC